MIAPAPNDFWKQVIDRVADLIVERDKKLGGPVQQQAPPGDTGESRRN